MSSDIGAIPAVTMFDAKPSSLTTLDSERGVFLTRLDQELSALNKKIVESDSQLRDLANGNSDNLHQVMMALEEAKLSFQLALQVRNRVLEAYQEVLRMQV